MSACLYITGRQEIGLVGTGDPIDPDIPPVLSEVKFQDLLNGSVIINAPVTGFQVFGPAPLLIRLLSRRFVSNRLLRVFSMY